jgi:hypothetical protein
MLPDLQDRHYLLALKLNCPSFPGLRGSWGQRNLTRNISFVKENQVDSFGTPLARLILIVLTKRLSPHSSAVSRISKGTLS